MLVGVLAVVTVAVSNTAMHMLDASARDDRAGAQEPSRVTDRPTGIGYTAPGLQKPARCAIRPSSFNRP